MIFDIRIIIGALLGLYGLTLVVTGLFQTVARERGAEVNVWSGAGMAAAAVVFIAWASRRPLSAEHEDQKDEPAVPLPAISSPLLPTPSSEPSQPAPRD
ncbi:hypothetical protein [Nocardia sp. NPDC050793]|uniref:hypothetical protein n=1 Tax=Nocardia sp. NPDC050793 TaxID=3155159 RepID=UPI003408D869